MLKLAVPFTCSRVFSSKKTTEGKFFRVNLYFLQAVNRSRTKTFWFNLLCYWGAVVELDIFNRPLSKLNWHKCNWRIFSSHPLWRIFTHNPSQIKKQQYSEDYLRLRTTKMPFSTTANVIFTMFTCEFRDAGLGTGSTGAPQFGEISAAAAQQTGQQEPHR